MFQVESSGTVLIGGFSDGRIKMFAILFGKTKERSTKATDQCIRIIQVSIDSVCRFEVPVCFVL